MILRRYGTTVQSVEPDFRPHALNEISFRRDRSHSVPADEFEAAWERVAGSDVDARAEGDVHSEVEKAILDTLVERLEAERAALGEGEALLIENEMGVDWPRTRQQTRTVVVDGQNRLHFTVHVDPPLRLGLYRRR